MLSPFSDWHSDMTTIVLLGSLIPPLTAEMELSFSLMKVIYTRLRNRLLTKNLIHCVMFCKCRDLSRWTNMNKFWNCGWKQMKPKTKKERFHHDYSDKFFNCICLVFYLLCFYFLISSWLKSKRYLQWPHPILCMEFTTSFFPYKSLFDTKKFLVSQPLLWD